MNSFVHWRKRFLSGCILTALFALLALWLVEPINLTAVDIGRHIKNGELILQGQREVLYKNFYSFTNPEYPFINHHWFFGVISYVVWKYSGFNGLALGYIAVMLLAVWFFLRAALLRGNFSLAVFLTFLALPLLWDRKEIRPEGVSALFMGIYFYLLTEFSLGQIRPRLVFLILGLLQILWVNTHIFFFMGPLLVAVFLWEGYARRCSVCVKHLWPLLGLVLAASLVNPSGIWGALTPLNVFKGFGYRLAENQNVLFMMSFFPDNKVYPYYLVLLTVMFAGIILAVWARGWKPILPFVALALFAGAAGARAVRLMSDFGFFFIPLATFFYSQAKAKASFQWQTNLRRILTAGSIVLLAVYAWPLRGRPLSIGLMPGVNASAEFFKTNGLKGPIFSNYDIGGYLIYHLAPQEKVFVDNRQEAFPPDFFKNVYTPMQEDDKVWQQMELKYQFNAIYFYRHDLTPWGQDFLIARIQDPDWAPVFVDAYTIIFLKRNVANQPLIQRFELPKSMFFVQHS